MVCVGLGALLASAVLKKTGHPKASAVIGSVALPILASACYKKYSQVTKEKNDAQASSGIEYNH
ncbi:hypothetical protein D3C72_2553360 [compost metagenome]